MKKTNLETILDKNWVYLVNRPYNLFGASLYQRWFDPPQIYNLFGVSIPDNLYIEEHPNLVRRYVIEEQQRTFQSRIKEILENDRKKAKEILERGIELSEQVKEYLAKSPFSNLNSAVDFLVELALHATVFSYFSYPLLEQSGDQELLMLAEKLRSISYYPEVVDKIINPLAEKEASDTYQFLTLSEVLTGDTKMAAERIKASEEGKRFVYAKIAEQEFVEYVDDAMGVISNLEETEIGQNVKGQVAYPGKIIGRARLVLTSDLNSDFGEGDVLIAATTNPTLMSLIKKAGAIVTDEGGITCHAAIISRELKKPCIIGTKFATHAFKDGDLVEVDANNGIVKIIK
ncbi:MAG: PEP-utilizing enzyme [Patescibacteria group bacterium]|nr:PEP-utilizing enzyme [Patescibacteria group bacterium]